MPKWKKNTRDNFISIFYWQFKKMFMANSLFAVNIIDSQKHFFVRAQKWSWEMHNFNLLKACLTRLDWLVYPISFTSVQKSYNYRNPVFSSWLKKRPICVSLWRPLGSCDSSFHSLSSYIDVGEWQPHILKSLLEIRTEKKKQVNS